MTKEEIERLQAENASLRQELERLKDHVIEKCKRSLADHSLTVVKIFLHAQYPPEENLLAVTYHRDRSAQLRHGIVGVACG